MQKIMFNERYGLQSAVYEKIKTHTRREPFFSNVEIETHFDIETGKFFVIEKDSHKLIHTSRYALGEIVAIAQSYSSVFDEAYDDYFNDKYFPFLNRNFSITKGWKNKMFVKAEYMPHHIRITNIRCVRLQEISDEDCLKEGILTNTHNPYFLQYYFFDGYKKEELVYNSAKLAFINLITRLNGRKFWQSNPYVIVYEFELID